MDLTARDIMVETVVACVPDTRAEDAVKALAEKDISGMPVVDAHKRVVGVVSERDLLLVDEKEPPVMGTALYGLYVMPQRLAKKIAERRGVLVRDIMTSKPITFHPDDPVREIARAMREKRVNRVPIVDEEGVLVGIITRGDIIAAMAERA
jgi:CBS domain-containing protein